MSRFRMSRFPRGGSLVVDDSRSGRPCTCYAPSIDQKLLRDGNKTGLGDLRSAVPAGLETRAERGPGRPTVGGSGGVGDPRRTGAWETYGRRFRRGQRPAPNAPNSFVTASNLPI
jgi:hypothetical protein